MDRRAVLAFALGLVVGGLPLAAHSYALNRQLSGLESELGLRDLQLAGLQGQIDNLTGEVATLQEQKENKHERR